MTEGTGVPSLLNNDVKVTSTDPNVQITNVEWLGFGRYRIEYYEHWGTWD